MPPALLYKSVRTKKIKINRHRASPSQILQEGDVLQLFLSDEFFANERSDKGVPSLSSIRPRLNILYEDDNILLLNKRPGVSVHEDEHQTTDNLLTHIHAYLYQKGLYDPNDEQSFAPALCNRIDRNTGGILIAAKNAEALRVMNEKIRMREIDKYYLCLVHGTPKEKECTLHGFLRKLPKENRVLVYSTEKDVKKDKAALLADGEYAVRDIRTHYRVLETKGDISLLEVKLLTGRTHQIRAHMAHVGHPLVGDGKYGINRKDKEKGFAFQALYAYRLHFSFPSDDKTALSYLNGMLVTVPPEDVYFLKDFSFSL